MGCLCNHNNYGCGRCPNFLKTLQVIVDGGEVVLLTQERVFENYERLMLCIAQSIPATSTNETVYIQSGITNTTRYQLRTTDGNEVYAYQLKSRTAYPITASINNEGFVINPRHLCHTTQILSRSAAPVPAETPNAGDEQNG